MSEELPTNNFRTREHKKKNVTKSNYYPRVNFFKTHSHFIRSNDGGRNVPSLFPTSRRLKTYF